MMKYLLQTVYAVALFYISAVFCGPISIDDVKMEIQKFFSSTEFQYILKMATKKNLQNIGACIKKLGENAGYNIEMNECFNCTVSTCSEDDVCTAQCREILRISHLEIENRSLRADVNFLLENNSRLYIGMIVIGGLVTFLVVAVLVSKFYSWRMSKYDKALHPGDDLPQDNAQDPPNYAPNARDREAEDRAFLPQ